MPDPTPPPPPPPAGTPSGPTGKPIDDWFDGSRPPWDGSTPDAKADAADPPPVMPVARPKLAPVELIPELPPARPIPAGPHAVPRPLSDGPRYTSRPEFAPRPAGEAPAVEPDRPRSQVFLACSVLIAIIIAMMLAVAVLGYAVVTGFKKVQTRTKSQNAPVVGPQQPGGRVPNANPRPRRAPVEQPPADDDK